ncbi:MAG: hypothetical protein JW384_03391 [Nitrosomonadaceae bacterium]|nr:hypothetical protein [Nitrosomonadaceae bacterium]
MDFRGIYQMSVMLKIKSEIVKIYGEESKDIKYHELLARVDYIIKLYYL